MMKKTKPYLLRKKCGKHNRQIKIEHHILVIQENKYLGYPNPSTGTVQFIERAIIKYFIVEDLSLD